MAGYINEWINRSRYGWMAGCIDGWMDDWFNGWVGK